MKKALFTMFIFGIFAVVAFSSKASAQTFWYGNGSNNGYYNNGYNNYSNHSGCYYTSCFDNYGYNNFGNNWGNNWGNNFGFNQNSYYPIYTPGVYYPNYSGYGYPYGGYGGYGGGMSINLGFIFNK
ncbi:MAG: hypothetical protein QG630_204 [Patescibacteria group bacterium]|nr:hypothetical protein [Patescibacteria group bacterium]